MSQVRPLPTHFCAAAIPHAFKAKFPTVPPIAHDLLLLDSIPDLLQQAMRASCLLPFFGTCEAKGCMPFLVWQQATHVVRASLRTHPVSLFHVAAAAFTFGSSGQIADEVPLMESPEDDAEQVCSRRLSPAVACFVAA